MEAEAVAIDSNAKLLSGDYSLEVMPMDGPIKSIDGKVVASNLLGYWRPIAVDADGSHYLNFELVHKPVPLGF